MAAFTALDVNLENYTDVVTTASIAAAAASQTVDMTGFKRLMLYVKNADAAADAYVTIKAGDGIRSSLGALIVKVEKAKTTVIKVEDTERHCVRATGVITVELNDNAGAALAAGVLEDITLLGVRE